MDKISEDNLFLPHLHEGRLTAESLHPNLGKIRSHYNLSDFTPLNTTSGLLNCTEDTYTTW